MIKVKCQSQAQPEHKHPGLIALTLCSALPALSSRAGDAKTDAPPLHPHNCKG